MNIIDVVILLMIGLFGVIGFKRGFFTEAVNVIGIILAFVLSFMFKDPLADFFMSVMPFFNFFGSLEGAISLNVIMYQSFAFLIIFGILMALLRILLLVTGVFEKILKFTIILAIPSKVLGFILGLIEGYVIVMLALFFFRQPAFGLEIFQESELAHNMVNNTPILTPIVSSTNESVNEIYNYIIEFNETEDVNQLNLNAMDSMLKHKVISVDSVEMLIANNKLDTVPGLDNLLNKYR